MQLQCHLAMQVLDLIADEVAEGNKISFIGYLHAFLSFIVGIH